MRPAPEDADRTATRAVAKAAELAPSVQMLMLVAAMSTGQAADAIAVGVP